MKYALAQEHRIGMRETNQDYTGHDATAEALLLIVADGMGGYFGGELAAEIAVGSVLHSFGKEAQPQLAEPDIFLERAFARAHLAIQRYAAERELPQVPRTVIVACVVQAGHAWWNHVGDARLYLVRDGRIEAKTRDHTQVQLLVDAGEIPPEQAYSHPESTRMLQSLGSPSTPVPGPGANAQLQKDDILLLCSDGFWGPLRTGQLLRGLEGPSLRQCILELSDIAERRAGSHGDNLSVLAMQWQDQELSLGDGSATRPESRKADAAGGSQHSESGNG
ncbi:MAG: serine/threonine-protein phosphatase [Gammaproteobacteria bacterium]|nr:MAG: serine/threonine-protein phosphatase [Gammaproteobacteria bacterium]